LNINRPEHRQTVLAGGVAAALLLIGASPDVGALTLGRGVVQSNLGERMRAEIEFESLTAPEAESLRATIASPDEYRQAGVQFNPSLGGARVVLQRIANRRASLLITTDRPIQEPFVDVVLQLSWNGGRLVRTYTLLVDPPGMAGPARPPSLTPYANPLGLAGQTLPSTAPPAAAPAPAPVPGAAPVPAPMIATAPRNAADRGATGAVPAPAPAAAPVPRRGPPPVGAPPAPPLVDDPYRVRPGDTLSEMAQRGARPAGVSLDRLVLAMYRDNPDAFADGNIHKLKKGVVLSAAKPSTIASITDEEARRIIKAQSADFDAYRAQLAQAPTERPVESTRRSGGAVETAVEDQRRRGAAPADVLTLSKPGAASAAAAADPDARAAARRDREQSAARVAELQKNVQDLARLSGSVASQPAAGAASAAASAPAAAAATATASAAAASRPSASPMAMPGGTAASGGATSGSGTGTTAGTGTAATGPTGATGGTGTTGTTGATGTSTSPSTAASEPASAPIVVAAIPARPRAVPPPTVAVDEPGMLDSMLDDNLPAVGLVAALLALLAGFGVVKWLRRRREEAPQTSFLESRLKPDSFFAASGGERVDTSLAAPTDEATSSMMNYSLSQLDAIGDVDPVAEADVYLAYGRDMQAEEILKEAMRTSPDRLAIRTKLLEVYAKRRDTQAFELLALELFSLTQGHGDDWARARQLGHQIDPDNALYLDSDGAPSMAAAPAPDSAHDTGPDIAATMPLPVMPEAAPPAQRAPVDLDLDLDLDLGADDEATLARPTPSAPLTPATQPARAPAAAPADDGNLLDFSTSGFDLGAPSAANPASPAPSAAPSPSAAAPANPSPDPVPFSMSAFSLDLDLGEPSQQPPNSSMLPPLEGKDSGIDDPLSDFDPDSGLDEGNPLERKLELADEFRQIGDLDGARDLLHEVIESSDGALKAKAQAMLASLS
jgi:pilus assembly protein FimV